MKHYRLIASFLLVFVLPEFSWAVSQIDTNKFWSEARVFITQTNLANSPAALSALNSADGVGGLSKVTGFGIEGNFNVARYMKAGLRGGAVWEKKESAVATNTNAFTAVQQGWGGAILRFPLVRSDMILFDVFGEAGATVSHVDVSTMSNGSGTFTKSFNPYERAGASLGFGWTPFYVFVEGGYHWNNLSTMSYSGNLSNNISSIDLSGTYLAAGFILNGLPGFMTK